jgi:hypothetical protein
VHDGGEVSVGWILMRNLWCKYCDESMRMVDCCVVEVKFRDNDEQFMVVL